jgi:hypothetical protein
MKTYIYVIAVAFICAGHPLITSSAMAGSDITIKKDPSAVITVSGDPSVETPGSETRIGSVKTIKGNVSIVRNNQIFKAKVGTMLLIHDTLVTEKNSAVGVTFKDNGVLSIGPKSKLVVDDFVFNPENNKFSMITGVLKGSCTYLGGLIAKLKPRAVLFNTPSATIGIRGTYFAVKVGN